MGIFSQLFEKRGGALPLNDNTPWVEAGIMRPSAAGVHVTPSNSLKYAAVLACVRVLAESVASLPLKMYERLPGDQGRREASSFYLHRLLHDAPNPLLDSFEWRELTMTHLLLWGNAYSEIEYNGRGQVAALWPLMPGGMISIGREGNEMVYTYQLPMGGQKKFAGWQLLHIRGLGLDGLAGMSPIGLARQAVGLGLAAEEFGARFFGNGANMDGILSHPGVLGKEAADRLQGEWSALYSGLSNSHRTAILEEGMKYERIGIPPEDAQFLETRKFQTAEIARIYRVPPHMIGDLERATFSNIEHQSLEFVMHSLRPWLVRWEQAISERLMTARERSRYYPEFLITGLLRGDNTSRAAYYTSMFNIGAMSQNDIRRAENLNPVDNGDEYFVPLNMIPASQAGFPPVTTEPEPAQEPEQGQRALPDLETRATRSATARHRLQRIHFTPFEDVAGRILRREANDVSNAAARYLNKRTVPEFEAWLDEFYQEHATFSARQWLPVLTAYAAMIAQEAGSEVDYTLDDVRLNAFIQSYAEQLGQRQSDRSRKRIDSILADFGGDALAEINSMAEEWRTTRPAGVANEETVRSNGAVSHLVYLAAGIMVMRWFAIGKSCPYCRGLDGKTVGITQNFLTAGETIGLDAPNGPLTVTSNKQHAPAHRGCLPGDSLVLTRDRIASSSERWFDGNLVVIQTTAGYELSCTPNHPVLTSAGWVAAGALNIGDYVICDRSIDWVSGRDIYGQYMPSLLHDVVKSVGGAGNVIAVPVPTTAEDFHGDGANSKIAIIRTNGDLLDVALPPFGEQSGEFLFDAGYANPSFLAGESAGAIGLETIGVPYGSSMGGGHLCSSLIIGAAFPDEQLSVGTSARSDTGFQQMTPYSAARDAELLGQGQFGIAGEVFADEIISVKLDSFHGYVYNLETDKGYYIANGIIVHNCDCQIVAG